MQSSQGFSPNSELSATNAAEWLRGAGLPSSGLTFQELGGGISNKVVLVEGLEFRAVLKQPLGQLRTRFGWHSDRERIFREAAAMRWISERCGHIPKILFEDRPTMTIAMEAAPARAEMWKARLFRGEHDRDLARAVGVTLGSIIASSWCDAEAERLFGDQTVFDQLRIEPYYRFTAQRVRNAADYIARLIEKSAARRVSLVHGDWSPKNLLVHRRDLWAIDWEVIHYGDPSFDIGFLLNHLLMKSFARPQDRAGLAELAENFAQGLSGSIPAEAKWILPAGLEHLPALLLARVEGKSPAEYLDEPMRRRARALALDLMLHPAVSFEEVFRR